MPGAKPIRIPFDSLTLAAVAWEMQPFIGAQVQRIHQPDEWTVGLALYSKSAGAGLLLLSCHPEFARAHLATRRIANQSQPPVFCATLRSRLEGGPLDAVRQIDFDRVLEIRIGSHRLIAELMGKHSNLILVDEHGKTVSAAKWVGRAKSSRPIQPGGKYHPPPFPPKPPLFEAEPGDDLTSYTGASPFLVRLIGASPAALAKVREVAGEGRVQPVLAPGHGAYPISVAALGLAEFPRSSISVAIEQHYDALIPAEKAAAIKRSLRSQIERVVLAREVALSDLTQARDLGDRAGEIQRVGELILAYGPSAPAGARQLDAFDFDGVPVKIELDPELDFKQNASAFFERAKRAKSGASVVKDQIGRLAGERSELEAFVARLDSASRLDEVESLKEEASSRRWLHHQPEANTAKEDRPYQGHRVRELVAPGGWPILYGENAEANDYLILRVAKPNDWWLHVRGNTSSHVVIVTRNQPEKVAREAIEYAARIAVQHSPLKHSGFVPVDYTLRKYVRKQKGAPKGSAFYTHEKTLHIES